jgi:hypothetical protein
VYEVDVFNYPFFLETPEGPKSCEALMVTDLATGVDFVVTFPPGDKHTQAHISIGLKNAFTFPGFFGVPRTIIKDNGGPFKHLEDCMNRLSEHTSIRIYDRDA